MTPCCLEWWQITVSSCSKGIRAAFWYNHLLSSFFLLCWTAHQCVSTTFSCVSWSDHSPLYTTNLPSLSMHVGMQVCTCGCALFSHSPLQPSPLCWPASPAGLVLIATAPTQRCRWTDLEAHSETTSTQLRRFKIIGDFAFLCFTLFNGDNHTLATESFSLCLLFLLPSPSCSCLPWVISLLNIWWHFDEYNTKSCATTFTSCLLWKYLHYYCFSHLFFLLLISQENVTVSLPWSWRWIQGSRACFRSLQQPDRVSVAPYGL